MDALLAMLIRQVPDFKMIAKFIASPAFYCPWSGDPWGFALLCEGAAWLRPAFALGEPSSRWQLLFGVFTVAGAAADLPKRGRRVGNWMTRVSLCPGCSHGAAYQCAGKWATLPLGQPADAK